MWKGKMAAQILSKIFGMATAVNGHDPYKSNIQYYNIQYTIQYSNNIG